MGVKHRVLPEGQPPTAALTVFAQLGGPRANETEMGAALFTKNGERRNFDFDFLMRAKHFQNEDDQETPYPAYPPDLLKVLKLNGHMRTKAPVDKPSFKNTNGKNI